MRHCGAIIVNGCVCKTCAKMQTAGRPLRAVQCPDWSAQRSQVISGPASPMAGNQSYSTIISA